MYLTIVRHITKRGPHTGQILYELNLHAYQGGPVHMRSARYYTLAKAQSVAGDLVMGVVPWGDELPGEVGVKFGAKIMTYLVPPVLPVDVPLAIDMTCTGLGPQYPHVYGTVNQCPDCAENMPPMEPEQGKAASEGGKRKSRSSRGSAGDPSPDKQPPGGSNAG